MNCLLNIPRFSALPLQSADSHQRRNFFSDPNPPPLTNRGDLLQRISMKATSASASNAEVRVGRHRRTAIQATSGSASSAELNDNDARMEEEKSEMYSKNMTEAMGADLMYKHEDGMNYNFIRSDLIVGSCLQSPEDVDELREIGVKTIFCLQRNPDLEYFKVDIEAIREYARTFDDTEHVRADIRDFDAHDLRLRLPDVVRKLHKAVNRNGGVTYLHCTAGLGRAPAVALAYMVWVLDYKFDEALSLLLSKRSCYPKVSAVKSATADILTGLRKMPINLFWKSSNCSTVEIAGLDIGWGQRIPLKFDESQGMWTLERELYEGRYEYKYIVDGHWKCNEHEPLASPNKDGHVNNHIEVFVEDPDSDSPSVRKRLLDIDCDLTAEEREEIKEFLEACSDDDDIDDDEFQACSDDEEE